MYKNQVLTKLPALQAAAEALSITQIATLTSEFSKIVNKYAFVLDAQAKFKTPSDFAFWTNVLQQVIEEQSVVMKKDLKIPTKQTGQ